MDNWIEDKFSKDKEGWILIFTVKDDGWILQIEELNTQDAEPCFLSYFLSYFQLRSLEIKIMLLSSLFFFFKGKKQKALFSYKVMSFLSYMSFLCSKKKSFCLLPTCLIFSAMCQNLTVNFWFYHLFSTHEKNSNYFKYRVCGFFLISILKPFTPNPSLPNLATHCIFWCLAIKSFWFHIVVKSAT